MPPVKKEMSIGTQHQLAQNLDNLELAPTEKELAKETKKLEKEKEKEAKQKEKELAKEAKQKEKEQVKELQKEAKLQEKELQKIEKQKEKELQKIEKQKEKELQKEAKLQKEEATEAELAACMAKLADFEAKELHEKQIKEGEEMAKAYRHKTKLCKFFNKKGGCKLGDKCTFAHGVIELRKV